MNTYFMGIEIGGSKFQAVIGKKDGTLVDHYRAVVNKDKGAEGIRQEIIKAWNHFKAYKPAAIGIGFGGPVDIEAGIIRDSHHIKGWTSFPLQSWLKKHTGVPVAIDNDANVAGLAEALLGKGKKFRKIFYVCLGSGMGGGMITDGEIFHGMPPGEAEIGLIPFDREGRIMEKQCCGWAADEKIRQYTATHPDSPLARLTRDIHQGEAKFLMEAIRQGDSGARQILEELADNIAFALSYAVHLFHPQIIVIGGGLSLTGRPLFDLINKFLPHYVHPSYQPPPKVMKAGLGEKVVCYGALLLAIRAWKQRKNKLKK